jgi:HSP20 family protein
MLWSELERLGRFFDPWREFERMNRAASRLSPVAYEFPAVNMWMSEDDVIVTTEIPGVDPASIDISVVGSNLTLKGSRQPDDIKEGEAYHRRERWGGQFTRTMELPFDVESAKVEARYVKGILTISLPRAEAEKPRKISVKAQ